MVQAVRWQADNVKRARQPEEMLPLLKRHEIQVLRRAGHSQAEVAKLAGVSTREVRRIDEEARVTHADDAGERKRRRIGRPSKAEPYRGLVTERLAENAECMSLEILRQAKLVGYTGSKSAMYALIASVRPAPIKPIVRFEGVAGEFSQHDFGEVDVRFLSGSKKRIHFFASRLKYSRWVEVSLVDNEQVEPLLRSLVDHFTAFGGVPLLAVFDRPKTIVVKANADGSVREWNTTFAQAMLELGVGVELCWPRSGNQKGSVERLVGWVKNSFFKPRRFLDEADLREQLAAWHLEVNTKTVSRATGVTPAARMTEERARLRALKLKPADFALRVPVVVGPTAEVVYDAVAYSMPPASIHVPATLHLYRDRVRIVAGRHVAEHRRRTADEPRVALPEHRAQMLSAVSGTRAKRYYKREQLLRLGAVAAHYLTELVHRRPKIWTDDVELLFEMLQTHGEDRLVAAFERALAENVFGAEYVARLLSPQSAPATVGGAKPKQLELPVPVDGAHTRGPASKQRRSRDGRAEPK